jgi:hypothetical protein
MQARMTQARDLHLTASRLGAVPRPRKPATIFAPGHGRRTPGPQEINP